MTLDAGFGCAYSSCGVYVGRFNSQLEALGLTSVDAVRAYRPEQVLEDHRGNRDVSLLQTVDDHGVSVRLYLKRTWRTKKENGIRSLLRTGKVRSVSRIEAENCQTLNDAGFATAEVVAWGEDCGPLWERFSFIITHEVQGISIDRFIKDCTDRRRRRDVLRALAKQVRRLHDAGLFSPDLYTRHIFLTSESARPEFTLIDMARLDRRWPTRWLRARDLAAINISSPLQLVSSTERVLFLRVYSAPNRRELIPRIRRRVQRLLQRSRFAAFEAQTVATTG